MNFWTGLILGVIIGWLVEWIIDWLFWRRDAAEAQEEAELLLAERQAKSVDLDEDWGTRLADADLEYQERLRAVEGEWQDRLNLNEQQWQSQFTALEDENENLRARLTAGATLGAAGAALSSDTTEGEVLYSYSLDDSIAIDDADAAAELAEEDEAIAIEFSDYEESWEAEQMAIAPVEIKTEPPDFSLLGEVDNDLAERLRLAGVDSIEALAAADPAALSVTTGLERAEAESWIARAGAVRAPEIDLTTQSRPLNYQDDLTRIRGIGPRYAALLGEAGITTYDDLIAASPDRLRDIIKPSAMQQLNFDSWNRQAQALAETREARAGDDLTELEGIGPVYASKLRDRGIATFADLAATDEATLGEIIGAPAWRKINYGEWIEQARLTASGDTIALEELKSRLFRRGGDNLSLIRGMGERSATALQAGGITSFSALAQSSPQQLDEIIRNAGVRGGYAYEAWISEAELRAAGKRIPGTRSRAVQIVPCPQDLSAVSGIGPVYEERLYAAGIGTYWSLAELPAEELARILELKSFQDVDMAAISTAAMNMAAETNSLGRGWDGSSPDDFDGLPEIGEVYERRLYEAGICTYEAMAAATPERLAEICKAPPMRIPNYAAWIATAAELSAAKRSG